MSWFDVLELILPYLFYGRRWHTITRFIRSAWRWWSTCTSYTPMQWPFLIYQIQDFCLFFVLEFWSVSCQFQMIYFVCVSYLFLGSIKFRWNFIEERRKHTEKEQNAESKKREKERDGRGGKKRRTKNWLIFCVIDLLGCWFLIFKYSYYYFNKIILYLYPV